MTPHQIVIIGGGISGLSAAWAAMQAADEASMPVNVTVLERSSVVGGKAQSFARDGWVIEGGPTGIQGRHQVLDALLDRASLGDERIVANPQAARRFIFWRGACREATMHPLKFAISGILDPLGLIRIAAEPLVARRRHRGEESVWSFARRRIGRQAADRLISPMALGVFAGDAKKLSLPAAFPKIASLEQDYGSLIRGAIHLKRQRCRDAVNGALPTLWSLRRGLNSLAEALVERAPFTVRLGHPAVSVSRRQSKWVVSAENKHEELIADAVIVATEGKAAANLLANASPAISKNLNAIAYPPVAVVAMGFDRSGLSQVPRGFGVLIPRGSGIRTLGVLWDSHIFAGRCPDGHLLLRAMLGGRVDPQAAQLPEDELVALVRRDLVTLTALKARPLFHKVIRWTHAIPQYEIGHLRRRDEIERDLQSLPFMYLAGTALNGVAFAQAAQCGDRCGRKAVEDLRVAAKIS